VGGEEQHGEQDALDYKRIQHREAGKFGTDPILSVLPDKLARFLNEFHDFQLEVLDLSPYPQITATFGVRGALTQETKPVIVLSQPDHYYNCHNQYFCHFFLTVWYCYCPIVTICIYFYISIFVIISSLFGIIIVL
jgi:hypothetical protein